MSFIFVALMLRETSRTIMPLRWFASTSFFVGSRRAVSAAPSRKQSAATASTMRCTVVLRIAVRRPSMSATGMPARRRVLPRPAIAPREDGLAHFSGQRAGLVALRCRFGPSEDARREREVVLAGAAELVCQEFERLPLLGHDAVRVSSFDEQQRALERRRQRARSPEARAEAVEQHTRKREERDGSGDQQCFEK